MICGLRRPGSGSVTLGGNDITKLGPAQRARLGMARTFQGLELFGRLSVRDNLLVAAEMRHRGAAAARIVDDILDRVALGQYADRIADSLPTGVGRQVEVARALTTEPRIILLDEPAAGQDRRRPPALPTYFAVSWPACGGSARRTRHGTGDGRVRSGACARSRVDHHLRDP